MACAVCCCVSCHTSSGAPVFRLAAGRDVEDGVAQKGRRKEVPIWACKVCILRCLAGFCRDVQSLKKTKHATSSNEELCLGRYVCVLMWQWDGRHARLPHLRPDLVDIRASIWERSQAAKRTRYGVQEMPLVLARPCFFPLAQRPDVHYLADASKSPTAPRDRSMAPVPDSTQCTRKPRRRAGRRAQLG